MSLANIMAALSQLKDYPVVPALVISDLIFAPFMATRQGVSNDLDVILRDALIRFSSVFLVSKFGFFRDSASTFGSLGQRFSPGLGIILQFAALHTIHITLLRMIGIRGTTSDDTKQGRRGTISQRVMGTQFGVPVVPIVDIAIMTGASIVASKNSEPRMLVMVLLYLLALGGRQTSVQVRDTMRGYGVPVGLASATSLIIMIAGLGMGGGIMQRLGFGLKSLQQPAS